MFLSFRVTKLWLCTAPLNDCVVYDILQIDYFYITLREVVVSDDKNERLMKNQKHRMSR